MTLALRSLAWRNLDPQRRTDVAGAATTLIITGMVAFGFIMVTPDNPGTGEILLWATTLTLVGYAVAEFGWLRARRKRRAQEAVERALADGTLPPHGTPEHDAQRNELFARESRAPWWIRGTVTPMPMVALFVIFRSFLWEVGVVPSASMYPTLQVGDRIAVSKFAWGVRLPVLHTKLGEGAKPARGDIASFRYPFDPSQYWVKRIVALPGDHLRYADKVLTINGQAMPVRQITPYLTDEKRRTTAEFEEVIDGRPHRLNRASWRGYMPGIGRNFLLREYCTFAVEHVMIDCTVPAGHYFVMGDNRDDSEDSRFWGFLPEANLVGKVTRVLFSPEDSARGGPL